MSDPIHSEATKGSLPFALQFLIAWLGLWAAFGIPSTLILYFCAGWRF